jgi:PBP1b-binding outer membrane lipoprotein LpoB
MRRLVVIVSILVLGGCASPEQRCAQATGEGWGDPAFEACVQHVERQQQNSIQLMGIGASMMSQPQPASQPWTATCSQMGNFTQCSGN